MFVQIFVEKKNGEGVILISLHWLHLIADEISREREGRKCEKFLKKRGKKKIRFEKNLCILISYIRVQIMNIVIEIFFKKGRKGKKKRKRKIDIDP